MLRKTVRYTDFNDEEVTEELYFHFTAVELLDKEIGTKQSLSDQMKKIIAEEDGAAFYMWFRNFVLDAYGKKSEDGRRFLKMPQLRSEFESSEAFSKFFMELATDMEKAAGFVNSVVPKDLREEAEKLAKQQDRALQPVPDPVKEIVTNDEVANMSEEEFEEFNRRLVLGEVTLMRQRPSQE